MTTKVLITGGAGFIGRHTAHLFSKKADVEVVVLDDCSTGVEDTVIDWPLVKGNYGDKALVNDLMGKEKFDAVIHYGGNCDIDEGQIDPGKLYRNNVSDMINFLDCAAAHNINYIVYSSSATVYGTPDHIPVDEKHPVRPQNAYAGTKYAGELLLNDYSRTFGTHVLTFRYFNVSGSAPDGLLGETGVHIRRLVPAVIRTEIDPGYKLIVHGGDYDTRDGTCLRDYIHVEDIAEANYLAMKYIIVNNCSDLINLGSGTGNTVLDVIKAFEDIVGHPVNHAIGARRGYEPGSLVASNSKAKEILGWEAVNSNLAQILTDELNWKKYHSPHPPAKVD